VARPADPDDESLPAKNYVFPDPFGPNAIRLRAEIYPGGNLFCRQGPGWVVAFGVGLCRVPHTRGLTYLRYLLEHPDVDVAAGELPALSGLGPDRASEFPAEPLVNEAGDSFGQAPATLGDAGPTLDARARSEYEKRLRALKREREEAEASHDQGHLERIDEETEMIGRQLTAAFGLRGRPRKSCDTSERQRKAVRKCIADSIALLDRANPDLGRHLGISINTGTFCSYRPPAPTEWSFTYVGGP
jgi:non-specific serine/threonine protein kinase